MGSNYEGFSVVAFYLSFLFTCILHADTCPVVFLHVIGVVYVYS